MQLNTPLCRTSSHVTLGSDLQVSCHNAASAGPVPQPATKGNILNPLPYTLVCTTGFLLHHGLGLASCALGLYGNRMALFGAAIQVFFEGTTPLLHALGCARAMGLGHTRLFRAAGAHPA